MPLLTPLPDDEYGFDLPDFTNDFLALLRQMYPDLTGVATGWPRYRRGGSPRNWDVKREEHGGGMAVGNGFVQIGFEDIVGEDPPGGYEGSFHVHFPQAYSGRPLVFTSVYSTDPANKKLSLHVQASRALFDCYWSCGTELDGFKFAWLAFGPGGGTV